MEMHKRLLLVLLTTLTAVPSFAGSFFTNALVFNVAPSALEEYLRSEHLNAFLVFDEKDPSRVMVTEAVSDMQIVRAFNNLLEGLTRRFDTYAISVMVHDSDVLFMGCFQDGAALFEYNSQPGYFSGTPLAPQATGVAALTRLFNLLEGAFDPFLKAETVKSHLFAEALLADIYKELGQPLWPIGIGYSFLAERPEFIAIVRKQGLQIVEVP